MKCNGGPILVTDGPPGGGGRTSRAAGQEAIFCYGVCSGFPQGITSNR